MSFTFAQTVPYRPSQCPKCNLLVSDDRCKGFVTKDPFNDMLGTFKGESDEPCSKFVPAEPSVVPSKTEQQEENPSEVQCANCGKYFDWNEAYNQQNTPGSSACNPPGHGEFRPRAFCPHCGFLVAEWDIDQNNDRNQWKWHGQNEELNVGKELPPSPITLWGKSIPLEVRVPVLEKKIELSKMAEGASNEEFLNAAAAGDVATVKKQFLAGADINTKSYKGETAVMLAAMKGHTEVVKALIEAGVDINDQNVYGKHTPLILAALGGHLDVVKVLIEAGADPDLKNQFGKTAKEAFIDAGHSEDLWVVKKDNIIEDVDDIMKDYTGICDICGKPIYRENYFIVDSFFSKISIKAGFNPFKTSGIDMSRIIQMSRALGTFGKFPDEGQFQEALFQHWKQLSLQKSTDWRLCSDCNDGFRKPTKKSGSCFIATAAFYGPFAKEVIILRVYRDNILSRHLAGKMFIYTYYKISPYIADQISRNRTLQYLSRRLLSPLVKYCTRKLELLRFM